MNGDIHSDLRGMVEPQLQPVEVDRWVDDLVRPIARRYLEAFEADGHADIVTQFAEPVSVRSLGDLLGLQDVSSDKLRQWFGQLSRSFTNAAMTEDGEFVNPDGFVEGDVARAEIQAAVDPLIDKWIEEPAETAISHWLHDGMPRGRPGTGSTSTPRSTCTCSARCRSPGTGSRPPWWDSSASPSRWRRSSTTRPSSPARSPKACGGHPRSGRPPPASARSR
ncbi:hypothetical protein ACFQX8_07155 [Klenkia terrae]|uniref:hypothetical protein n=1 Tax=Klenkia terrae TaxID=1052259 RepID=UPI003606ACB3